MLANKMVKKTMNIGKIFNFNVKIAYRINLFPPSDLK